MLVDVGASHQDVLITNDHQLAAQHDQTSHPHVGKMSQEG
jgi:hypothetical protein